MAQKAGFAVETDALMLLRLIFMLQSLDLGAGLLHDPLLDH